MINPLPVNVSTAPARNDKLYSAAQQLEGTFLSEMLEAAGLGQSRSAFSGGAGEDQFSSFLVQEQASAIVRSGGIGLAETLYQALTENNDE